MPGHVAVRNYSEHTAQAIDQAVIEIVASLFKRALDMLTRNRETLEQKAVLLLDRETLTEVGLREVSATVEPLALPFVGRGFA